MVRSLSNPFHQKRASSQPLSPATAKRIAREPVVSGTPQVSVAKPKTIKPPPPGVQPGVIPPKARPAPAPPGQPKQLVFKAPPVRDLKSAEVKRHS